jgi:phage tail protein X
MSAIKPGHGAGAPSPRGSLRLGGGEPSPRDDGIDDSPIFGTASENLPAAFVPDATWIALGLPQPQRVIISTQGDWWDTIAVRAYGLKRGNESLMYRLLEANYPLRDLSHFPAGVSVVVPTVAIATEIPLVPWTSATIGP